MSLATVGRAVTSVSFLIFRFIIKYKYFIHKTKYNVVITIFYRMPTG